MRGLQLLKWSGHVLFPQARPQVSRVNFEVPFFSVYQRPQSTLPTALRQVDDEELLGVDHSTVSFGPKEPAASETQEYSDEDLPSPLPSKVSTSSRLAALHARLALSPKIPLNTLARCLIDPSADANHDFNNESLSVLGHDLLSYFTTEAVLARYPRLPTEVVFSAVSAYVGSKTLATITKEWGVETVHTPGGEVDPGLLQFARRPAGNALSRAGVPIKQVENVPEPLSATRPNPEKMRQGWRRGVSSRTMYEDAMGETIQQRDRSSSQVPPTTYEAASTSFTRALVGAIYLHTSMRNTQTFYNAHFLSRHLDVSALFSFRQPTRDLAKLCAREGFDPPVARILSETGRKSRHPVFVVGVFSGREKLGEGSGASLDEARFRAAVGALKGWYLYSPMKWRVPSEAVTRPDEEWEPLMVDGGEVIV